DPRQNKPGNPKQLGYALLHRNGPDLSSIFVSVIEPYQKQPFIKAVTRMDNGDNQAVVLKIEHIDERTDYVLFNLLPDKPIQLANGISLSGEIAYIQEREAIIDRGIMINGTHLKYRQMDLQSSGKITGQVIDMNKELTGGGWIVVDRDLPMDG